MFHRRRIKQATLWIVLSAFTIGSIPAPIMAQERIPQIPDSAQPLRPLIQPQWLTPDTLKLRLTRLNREAG